MEKMIMANVGRSSVPLKLRAGGYARNPPCLHEVPYPYLPRAGKFNEGPETWTNTFRFDSKTLDNPKPIGVVTRENTFEEYMGCPIKQTNGTCVLVACLQCLEAAHHRFLHKKQQGNEGRAFPGTRIHAALQTLFNVCSLDGTWVKCRGANPGRVLRMIQNMSTLMMSDESPSCALPLVSWEAHSGTALSAKRVADLLDTHGPCVGILWVCPWYHHFDAARDNALVYRGCGRSKANKELSEELYPGQVGGHAVVCYAYRFCREGEMDVLVMDNHSDATGPRRWIDVEELLILYTLDVQPLEVVGPAGASGWCWSKETRPRG